MRTTCLINNYNYGQFVVEAARSALNQTIPFDEILIVDDGSTDDSVSLLRAKYGQLSQVRIIEKKNQGQLSCFNEGFYRSTGDMICFLDADDLYEPRYLEEILNIYQDDPECDCVFVSYREFGPCGDRLCQASSDCDLGYSVLSAYFLKRWIGAPTSCLSMRRSLLARVLPVPYVDDWRLRADDCLVYGSSLAGGRKIHLSRPLVRYRVHGENHYHGRRFGSRAVYRRRLALQRLFHHFASRFGYDPRQLADLAEAEFKTIPEPSWEQLRAYARIVGRSDLRWSRKLRLMRGLLRHYAPHAGAERTRSETQTTAIPGRLRRTLAAIGVWAPRRLSRTDPDREPSGRPPRRGSQEDPHRHAA